ncbi:protein ADM2 isoform X1 [Falco naumanni]|uniref:protein ADM2 isoform X1 n=2 Tax=Falco naumanni TaxID=148594 RepID=UPI001ADE9FBD|nr:protein ADM2 isoform X1 [Falco naumanni]
MGQLEPSPKPSPGPSLLPAAVSRPGPAMRAPAPVALGCISLVLCLLELPACLPLPDGRSPKRREPPDRRPSPASLLGDHPGPQPPALPQPAGGPRQRPLIPRHGPKLMPRHGPRLSPRHGARLAPRHRLLIPRQHPKLIPRHRACLSPRHGHRPVLRHSPQHGPQHPRGRRHASGRLQHAQLLRVGCVLGTCQVQNLSHRLWQLMGQSGRQDSSPMNPNSPHSYG